MSLAEQTAKRQAAKMVKNERRILVMDIERLPATAYIWSLKTRYVPASNVITWPRLLCVAARWYGESETMFVAEWEDGGLDRMLQTTWEWFDRADIVVGYNSIGFDCGHLRTEWFQAGMTPPRPWRDFDLYRQVKKTFEFESNSLDSVTSRLDLDGKQLRYSIPLAFSAAEGDEEAQAQIKQYNSDDVALTIALYDKLRGWAPSHPHVAQHSDQKACPQCGGEEFQELDSLWHAPILSYSLWRCLNCSGYVRAGWVSRQANTRGVG